MGAQGDPLAYRQDGECLFYLKSQLCFSPFIIVWFMNFDLYKHVVLWFLLKEKYVLVVLNVV